MKWAWNDLKTNKGIWAGVLLVLVAVQTILCALSVSMGVNDYYMGLSVKTRDPAKYLASGLSMVYATAIALGCLVIMQTLQASIRQRRQGLALLSLLGATPRQVLLITMAQVLVLTLLASLVGALVSPLLAPRIIDFYSPGARLPVPFTFTWRNFPRSVLTGLATGAVVALLATRLTLKELEQMVPVQMLARAQGDAPQATATRVRGKVAFAMALLVLVMPIVLALYLSRGSSQALSKEQVVTVLNFIGSGPVLGIILLLVALARAGGPVIGAITRFWTRLVPVKSAIWKIARSQAAVRSRGKAFSATIVALASCIFLAAGMLAAGQTSTAAVRAVPGLENLTSGGPKEILSGLWAALLIAFIGALASFAISASERNLDLALVSVAGASPDQLIVLSVLDGFILMMTSIIIALGETVMVALLTAVAYMPISGSFAPVVPWGLLAAVSAPIVVIGSFATYVTARSALQESAIATIQTTIGE